MKVDLKKKRLRAVKSRFVFFPKKCSCCNEEFYFEKMWKVKRWTLNERTHDWFYCKKCIPTAEAVLHEVDTDASWYGIAFVDSYRKDRKILRPTPPSCGSKV